jgi:hypothetical protein
MLRRLHGPKREEVAGDWRKLHNEELHNLYSSPNVITVIKSRRIRWMEHVAHMEEMRNAYNTTHTEKCFKQKMYNLITFVFCDTNSLHDELFLRKLIITDLTDTNQISILISINYQYVVSCKSVQ